MRKNNYLMSALLSTSLLLSLASAKAEEATIKKGIKALTKEAVQGPQVDCDVNSKAPLSRAFSHSGADCSDFIRPDGSFGKLGKVISSHIDSMGSNALFHSGKLPGLQAACPKWSRLTKEQRDYFWVWLFAAISWKESTCGAATVNRAATHGTAIGHLQLNKNKKDRAWRGGDSGNSCAVKDIAPAEANMKCGVEILHEQLKGKNGLYEGNGTLYGRGANSYWHHLRLKNGGMIMKLMRDFPFCK